MHERVRDTAVRLDDVRMGAWAAFGRALLSGTYLADPRTAEAWCAWALALPRVEAFPRQRDNLLDQLGQAKGSTGELADARRIAEGLDLGTVLERMLLYWSGDWEQAEATWAAAKGRDERAGDRLDAALNAYWLGRVRRLLGATEAAEAAFTESLMVTLEGPQVPAEAMPRAELAMLDTENGRLEAGTPRQAGATWSAPSALTPESSTEASSSRPPSWAAPCQCGSGSVTTAPPPSATDL